jgi:hypothetical protein
MAFPMVCFEISVNGETPKQACVGESDQFEIALAKPLGDRDPMLSITVFAARSRYRNKNISWETDQFSVRDEIVIRIIEDDVKTESYLKSAEDLEKEKASALFCSFCGKGNQEVNSMIAGKNDVFICDECVDLAREIVETKKKE